MLNHVIKIQVATNVNVLRKTWMPLILLHKCSSIMKYFQVKYKELDHTVWSMGMDSSPHLSIFFGKWKSHAVPRLWEVALMHLRSLKQSESCRSLTLFFKTIFNSKENHSVCMLGGGGQSYSFLVTLPLHTCTHEVCSLCYLGSPNRLFTISLQYLFIDKL